ncbi:MAG: lyase family protein [Hymenobacter sp.]
MGAQMLRGKTGKRWLSPLRAWSGTLSKLAYDLVLYNSQDLGFVKFRPRNFTTGSSIMPHKKNPDASADWCGRTFANRPASAAERYYF